MNPKNKKPSTVTVALTQSRQQIQTCTQPQSMCESIEQCLSALRITGFYRLDCHGFTHTAHFNNGAYDLYNHQVVHKASDAHSNKIIELENHLVFKAPHIQLSINRNSETFTEIDTLKKQVMEWLMLVATVCQG